ncbi:substrate-binding domain-containing protein [Halococcus qingdaonensis]|uniref:substrate-binding domain-containing protein n=1 Tax=Halococcus qingdaonensis TaxID=224402 RepID=UPI0021165710|nr:substrate-binding domain-containing protein [Halococcus qingdaonensis]
MRESITHGGGDRSRRTFLRTAGASGAAVALAGCIAGGSQTDANTVRWVTDSTGADNAGAIRKALWNAGLSKDIYLDVIAGPQNTGTRQSQYTRWLSAGLEDPDLLMMDNGWALNFINRDQLLNLSDNLPERVLKKVNNDYFQASVETARGDDGDLYAVPLFPDFPTMLYRKDLVKQAGYNPEQENWATESMRWKKFSKVVADTKQQAGLQYGFSFQGNLYEGLACCDFNEFMTSWGGAYFGGRDTLFGPIGKRPVTVGEKPVVDAVKMVRTFIFGSNAPNTLDGYEQISPNAVLGWIEDSSLGPFTGGNAVALRNWPYAIATAGADDALGTQKLGVMPIPYAVSENKSKYKNIGGPVAALGGWHMTVNPNSSQRGKALQVIEAMTQPSFQLKLFELTGWLPPNQKVLDSRQAKQVPIVGNYIEQLRVAGENAIPRPVSVVWPQQSGQIAQQVHAGLSGDKPPKRAMNELKDQLAAIENYNR